MNEESTNFELVEPPSPEYLVPDSRVEPWMIVATAFVLAFLAILIFRKKRKSPLDAIAARQAALAEAISSVDKIGAVPAREAAVLCSLILRKYLSVATADPVLFETHEETIARDDALKDFSEEARAAAGLEFTRLAALKYAAEIPDESAPDIISGARVLLQTLHQGFGP